MQFFYQLVLYIIIYIFFIELKSNPVDEKKNKKGEREKGQGTGDKE